MPSRVYSTLSLATLAMFALASGASSPVSPTDGSDAVLVKRSGVQGELRLQYRVERESAPAEIFTIGLAKDYHYKNSTAGLWINDYRLRRIFRVQPGARVINDSLYADVWYREAERYLTPA